VSASATIASACRPAVAVVFPWRERCRKATNPQSGNNMTDFSSYFLDILFPAGLGFCCLARNAGPSFDRAGVYVAPVTSVSLQIVVRQLEDTR
jgi:hypothetical protein